MTTTEKTVEEVVEEFNIPKLIVDINTTQITDDGGNSYNEAFTWLEEEITLRLTQTLQAERQRRDEMVEIIKGLKKKEYEYEHTYPNEIGVDMGNGYEKRISKGQKQVMTHGLDDEELLYNQVIDDIIQTITQPNNQ